ncbi:MAG: hypothetical protein WAU68_15045 [Vitreimonas sp.]
MDHRPDSGPGLRCDLVAPNSPSGEQARIDRDQWRAIDLNRLLGWVNIAITLIGLAGLGDDLRFWHDQLLVPAGAWLKHHIPFALIPFDFIYLLVEWWRWAIHGLFDLIGLNLPRTLRSLIGVYVFLGNTTLFVLRGRVKARDRVPYTRLQFLKGVFLQLVDVRTLVKWLFTKPQLRGEYVKYLLDAILFFAIWIALVIAAVALCFLQVAVAKGALLVTLLSLYGVIMSDGLYVGTTRWYTLIFLCVVAFMYAVNSIYSACCLN